VIHAVGDILTASDWNIGSNDLLFLAGAAGTTVATSQSTASTSFTDLATVGPAVTVTTGANAIVMVTSTASNNVTPDFAYMGFAVSGATTIAASANPNAIGFTSAANDPMTISGIWLIPGLTPGSNTFTAKYQTFNNSATFLNRYITVIPLP
jgi:hypothetical protein